MKKSILLCIIFLGMQIQLQAQNAPLNKQQTLDYVEKFFKVSYQYEDIKILSVILDDKTLNISTSSGSIWRKNLAKSESLVVNLISSGYCVSYASNKYDNILWAIQTEADAKMLKKALEHLIEILKTEKSTDPFGE